MKQADETFLEAVQKQCNAMLRQAQRATDKGYMVLVHRLNTDAKHNEFLHGYIGGGFNRFAHDWHTPRNRRLIVVDVWPAKAEGGRDMAAAIRLSGSPFEFPFTFVSRIPKTQVFGPICAALELMSARRASRRSPTQGTGVFTATKMSACWEYSGQNRVALETFLRVLEMPHHREILTGKRQCPITNSQAA